jgi:hypothetical protein
MAKTPKKTQKPDDLTKNRKKIHKNMTAEQYLKALTELNKWQGVLLKHLQNEIK